MKKYKTKIDPFIIAGFILAVWAGINTYIDISRYGMEQGFYWWFCNLALIGMAMGILFKHRGWLTGFLSIACFTQVFWLIDNQYRTLMGKNLLGLVEFMYQPGLPIDEFLLSHYHYFTIPVALLALIFLPTKKSNALLLISIFNPFIFAVSYFLFPASQNVNCIHEPCIPSLVDWRGPTYSMVFWSVIFTVHLLIGAGFEKYFSRKVFNTAFKKRALNLFLVFCLFALVQVVIDTRYRLSLPSFKCESESLPLMKVACGFTLDHAPNQMKFVYRMTNLENKIQQCSTFLILKNQEIPLHQYFFVSPLERKRLEVVLPYPDKDISVTLSARCEVTSSLN